MLSEEGSVVGFVKRMLDDPNNNNLADSSESLEIIGITRTSDKKLE